MCLVLGLVLEYSMDQMLMLGFLCFNQFLLSFLLFLRSNIAGLQLFRIDSMISVLDRLLMIGSCGMILWVFNRTEPFRIEWFVYLQTVSYLITALIALAVVLKKGGNFIYRWNPALFRLILKKSLPFALLILLMSIYGRVDSVLLERLLPDGKEQTGIYAQAFRLLDASNMMAYLFAVLLLPMFSRMLKLGQDIRPLATLSSKLIIIPAATLALICWQYSTQLMELMYHQHTSVSGSVLSILMFSLIPMAGSYIFGTLLTANGSLKQLNFIALIGVVLSFTINLIMIPIAGSIGAAQACLATQLITFLLQFALAIRSFNFNVMSKGSLNFIIPISVLGISAYALRNTEWVMGIILLGIIGGLATLMSVLGDAKLIKRLKDQSRSI